VIIGESEQIDLPQWECVNEAEHVAGHVADVVGNDTRRGAYATVGEEDYLAVLSEAVDQHRIPVIEVAADVLQADQRRRFRLGVAEPPIGKRRSLDCDRAVLSIQRGRCSATRQNRR
jgi:hypothetical protein